MKHRNIIITLACAISVLVLSLVITSLGQRAFAAPPPPALTPQEQACQGVGVVTGAGGAGCKLPPGSVNVPGVLAFVINILSVIVGIVAVIMLIVGGYKYVVSQGEPNSIASAKSTILYAIVGLVIAASAQILVRFVLKKLVES